MAGRTGHVGQLMDALAGLEPRRAGPTGPVYEFTVERESDLLLLDISFHGFTYGVSENLAYLEPGGTGSVIVVKFPPQAIGEAAYSYAPPPDTWSVDPPPVLSLVSGQSQLCFTTSEKIVFSNPPVVTDLLDWSAWTLLVPAVAEVTVPAPTSRPAPSGPLAGTLVTYIEYPNELFLAPTVYTSGPAADAFTTTFVPRVTPPAAVGGVTDLFTATLQQTAGASGGGAALVAQMVAAWSGDYDKATSDTPETRIEY